MIPLIGELCATLAALCYGFSSVAVTKNARAGGGRDGAVLLSIMLTAAFSGGRRRSLVAYASRPRLT